LHVRHTSQTRLQHAQLPSPAARLSAYYSGNEKSQERVTAGQLVAVGTYTSRHPFGSRPGRAVRNLLSIHRPRAAGIYLLSFNPDQPSFGDVRVGATIQNPSWLARHPARNVLYAVSESTPGTVAAYEQVGTALREIGSSASGGAAPCYVSVDPAGRYALVANYASASVASIRLGPDGTFLGKPEVHWHNGSGPDLQRQASAHPHSVCVSPDGSWVLAPDLGADGIVIYHLDPADGLNRRHAVVATAPGAGPRHVVFHPDGTRVLLVNELNSTLAAYDFDDATGHLSPLHEVSTLPKAFRGHSTGADVRFHPDGRRAFVSNRGHDSIATVAIDASGALEVTSIQPTGGRTPRGLAVDPSGRFLLAAHQTSDEVIAFSIEGVQIEEAARVQIPTSACVEFL
jgi:6-phosphogluconolactonase